MCHYFFPEYNLLESKDFVTPLSKSSDKQNLNPSQGPSKHGSAFAVLTSVSLDISQVQGSWHKPIWTQGEGSLMVDKFWDPGSVFMQSKPEQWWYTVWRGLVFLVSLLFHCSLWLRCYEQGTSCLPQSLLPPQSLSSLSLQSGLIMARCVDIFIRYMHIKINLAPSLFCLLNHCLKWNLWTFMSFLWRGGLMSWQGVVGLTVSDDSLGHGVPSLSRGFIRSHCWPCFLWAVWLLSGTKVVVVHAASC